MSTVKYIVESVSIQAEEGKKYRVSAGSPISAVFWLTQEEMIALHECIDSILQCGV